VQIGILQRSRELLDTSRKLMKESCLLRKISEELMVQVENTMECRPPASLGDENGWGEKKKPGNGCPFESEGNSCG
jgi:hypothetical protein